MSSTSPNNAASNVCMSLAGAAPSPAKASPSKSDPSASDGFSAKEAKEPYNTCEVLHGDLAGELMRIQNVVALAAFAAEARRVLELESCAARMDKDFADKMASYVSCRQNWREFPDKLSYVLQDIEQRIGEVLSDVRG